MPIDKYFEWRRLGLSYCQHRMGIIDATHLPYKIKDDDAELIDEYFEKFGAVEVGHQHNFIYFKQDNKNDIHELRIFADKVGEEEYFKLEENFVNEYFTTSQNENLTTDLQMKKTGEFEINSNKLLITDRWDIKDETAFNKEDSKIDETNTNIKIISKDEEYTSAHFLLSMKNGVYETYTIFITKERAVLDKNNCLIHFKCCNKFVPFDDKILYKKGPYEWIHCTDCDERFGGEKINDYFIHKESKEPINFSEFSFTKDISHPKIFCDVIRAKDAPKKENYFDWNSDGYFKIPMKAEDSFYIGEFIFGTPNGYGMLVAGTTKYEGEFEDGYPQGKGILKGEEGEEITGTFKKGRMHGNMKVKTPDGKWEEKIYHEGKEMEPDSGKAN